MAFYYGLVRPTMTNPTVLTETTHLYATTMANQETVGVTAVQFSARSLGGGANGRIKANSGTAASGGVGQTPTPRNARSPSASSTWKNDGSTITVGGTLTTVLSVGFSLSGGAGQWVAPEFSAKIQMLANAANPVDLEFTSIASGLSIPFDLTVEFSEGI